jgi:hypothetical protein
MDGECSTHGEMRNSYKLLVGKSDGKRPLGRNGRGWEVKYIFKKEGMRLWTGFKWFRVGNSVGFL